MLSIFDPIRNLDFLSVLVKLLLSFICGGIIGMERSYKRRPAGLRTHILICLGATLTTLTGHYIYLNLGLPTDVSRIGAQVVSGLGFIGAGTIIVTKKQKVIGLTTAAGLWASGIIGLAIGSGFFEGALMATLIVMLVEFFLLGIENRMISHAIDGSLYITYSDKQTLDKLLAILAQYNITLTELKLNSESNENITTFMGLFSIRYSEKVVLDSVLEVINDLPHVISVNQL